MITSTAILTLDLVGTFAFAISGAVLAVRKALAADPAELF